MEGSTSSNVRWNPTKEQISILEGLYSQGMRTPTADQIQRITSRLRCYGNIEGKNVFYWFQNHKARQRQKEKQQHHGHHRLVIRPQQRCLDFAYVNRRCLYFHNSDTVVAAPALLNQQPSASSTNHAVFGPCYTAQNDMSGYNYASHPNVILPLGSSERRMNVVAHDVSTDTAKFTVNRCLTKMSLMSNETLDLFPVHPTGIPHDRKPFPSANQDDTTYSENCAGNARQGQPFFDFFSSNDRSRRD